MKQFNDVDSRRGAPMGRREFVENPEVTVNLFRVRMVDGDYDDGGAYWGGHSEPLWCARNPDEGVQLFVRANSQQEAKEQILDDWPHLQFDTYSLTNRATLDEMIEGYLDAAKFTDAPEGSRARFTRAAILKAEAVCLEFAQVCGGLADQAINLPGYGAYQLGFDFWLDRSGSGARAPTSSPRSFNTRAPLLTSNSRRKSKSGKRRPTEMTSHYTHCPQCGETCFDVDATANLYMVFTPGDPDGQVEFANSYDWNGDSVTQCVACKHSGHLFEFEHDGPWQEPQPPAPAIEWDCEVAIQAISARVNGVLDDPALKALGGITTDEVADIKRILERLQ